MGIRPKRIYILFGLDHYFGSGLAFHHLAGMELVFIICTARYYDTFRSWFVVWVYPGLVICRLHLCPLRLGYG